MSVKNVFINRAFFFCIFAGVSNTVWSAPGLLSDVPLYLGSGATPNILWVLDDSGSMNGEVLKRQALDGSGNYTGYPFGSGYGVNTSPTTKEELVEACIGYNALAFNPAITYVPWTEANGTSFPSQTSLSAVLQDPLSRGVVGATTVDLSGAQYVRWDDRDSDGNFDQGECWEDVAAAQTDPDDGTSQSAHPNYAALGGLVSVSGSGHELNYANWYTYYRKRSYVMKAVLTGVFSDADERFGLATINNDGGIATEIGAMTDTSFKQAAITGVLSVQTTGATPLKRALHNAGKYFDQEDGGANPENGFVTYDSSGIAPPPRNKPIKESCQANYTVMVTDGFYTADEDLNIGDLDTHTAGDGNPFNDEDYYGDGQANTMADLAMYYFSKDLDKTLPDNFKSNNPRDTNRVQHMVTYAVAFGVEGDIDTSKVLVNGVETPRPIAESWSVATNAGTTNRWPFAVHDDTTSSYGFGIPGSIATRVKENSPDSIDDLYHATFNSRGEFFNSGDVSELGADVQAILDSIASDTRGTAAAVGVNSTSISAGTNLFQAWFSSENWTGELRAFNFAGGTVGNLIWEAANELDNRNLISSPRLLLTYSSAEDIDNDGIAEGAGVVFSVPTNYPTLSNVNDEIHSIHVNDLVNQSYVSSVTAGSAQKLALSQLIDWFHGDKTYEGVYFRARDSLLGDIVSSSPQYVAEPNAGYPNHIQSSANPYFNYVTAKATRTPIVYVGSNDGMLHAFRASDGHEMFAYLPEILFTTNSGQGYHSLANTSYTHKPYVNATPTVRDVFVPKNGGTAAWRTYLVGGLSAGGKGVYVLDVSDPANFSAAAADKIGVMEFTHANLGFTYARPQISKLNNGKWAAIFGNGYNNNGSGEASLYILYLDGSGHVEISTGIGSVVNSDCQDGGSDCNGLSSASLIDLDADAIVDRVYAGDVHGNMWAFDLSDSNPNNWNIAHGNSNDKPLFTACRTTLASGQCPLSSRQPITAKPVVVAHQTENASATSPNLMVMFGTGQYLAVNDQLNPDVQAFYGVWDAGKNYGSLDAVDLAKHAVTTTQVTNINNVSESVRNITQTAFSFDEAALTAGFGWYIDLPTSKERSVLTPLITGDYVSFVTSIPDDATCSGGGSGWLMALNMFSGGQPSRNVFGDINSNVAGVALDNLSGGMITLGDKYVGADAIGDIIVEDANWGGDIPHRRASWSIIR